MKRFLTLCLSLALVFSLGTSAYAAVDDTGFSDVAADAWYADAVEYVRDNGLMSGSSATTFDPDRTTNRGQIVTILYRASGSPTVSSGTAFPDVADTAYYADAAGWASTNGIVSGYPNGNFGPGDPITRQQLATILWRYADSPAADRGTDFADENTIASYAATAVDWARENGIISGKEGNRFDPNGSATRAQVAVILQRYMERIGQGSAEPDAPEVPDAPDGSRVLVAYFSATNTTEGVAEVIANTLNADLFELEPADPYTSADLNYGNDDSRVVYEHEHPEEQNIELVAETVDNWGEYDIVFIGYPIWWHAAAWPVNRFITENDFTGKTVIPFCTSASSGLEGSDEKLRDMAGTGDWLPGRNFFGRDSDTVIADWVNGLDLPINP